MSEFTYNALTGNLDVIDKDVREDASSPTSKSEGYISVVGDTLWYFADGNRYKLTATLDNPPAGAGSPLGLLLTITKAA